MVKNFLNPKGHQNPFSGSKVMAILLKGWIWTIGEVALGRVRAAGLFGDKYIIGTYRSIGHY